MVDGAQLWQCRTLFFQSVGLKSLYESDEVFVRHGRSAVDDGSYADAG